MAAWGTAACADAPSTEDGQAGTATCDAGGCLASDCDAGPADGGVSPEAGIEPRTLRVMSFNIRHGAESSLEELASVINGQAPDLVGLQEVDNDAERSGHVHQSYRLGQLCGMASLFRAAIDLPGGGTYGLALLSRYPIITSDKLLLTSSGEQRIVVVVDVAVDDLGVVPFAITHLDLDASTRLTQAGEILAAIGSMPRAMLVGDLNDEPDSATMELLTGVLQDGWAAAGEGAGYTFPATAPARRIDFVLLGPSWPVPLEAVVPVTEASDHRPVVVTVPLPP